jgi:hypothetical protein
LKVITCNKGICAIRPGWIIIELNDQWEFDEIDIGGYGGYRFYWDASNGKGCSILTSRDKNVWTTAGRIPNNYTNTIQNVKLTRSTGRYIKFQGDSYLCIGYLIIKKLK